MARVRNVHGGTEKYTQVFTTDKMSRKSHAYHRYQIRVIERYAHGIVASHSCANINFQTGPIKEAGVNGCSNEDLLAIVADRLRCLQAGRFPCQHNEDALRHIEKAMMNLHDRTVDRERRGVEGQNKK